MPIKKGTKLPRGVGHIRLVCTSHKLTTEIQTYNSRRTFVEISTSSKRLNCCYCKEPARFISIPENVVLSEREFSYA
jgi:aspartate carbamoyltransferase regulatory subunit